MLEAQQAVEYLKRRSRRRCQCHLRYSQCRFWRSDQCNDHRNRNQIRRYYRGMQELDLLQRRSQYSRHSRLRNFQGSHYIMERSWREEQPVQTTSYVSEPEMKEIEQESSKINIPEFLLKSKKKIIS